MPNFKPTKNKEVPLKIVADKTLEKKLTQKRPGDMYADGWCQGCDQKYLDCVMAGYCKGGEIKDDGQEKPV